MTARSGRKCSALLTRHDPVGCLLRTCLESSRWNSTACYLTWKASATPRGRLLFRLVPSMPRTGETECGLWLTPSVQDCKTDGAKAITAWIQAAKNGKRPATSAQRLRNQALAQTLCARDATMDPRLTVSLWPTPCVPNGGRTMNKEDILNKGNTAKGKRQVGLENLVKLLPAPDAHCYKGGAENQRKGQLNGSLNPAWVEWLMGYPTGHTALKDWGTPSSRRSRSKSSKG